MQHALDLATASHSYPSGIAAETFMVCTILSLYLAGKLRLFVHARPVSAIGLWITTYAPALYAVDGMRCTASVVDVSVGLCCSSMRRLIEVPVIASEHSKLAHVIVSYCLQGHFALLLLSLLPVGLATFISVTRMSAYHHHFSDLNAGTTACLLSSA